jgi:hypothetical protein
MDFTTGLKKKMVALILLFLSDVSLSLLAGLPSKRHEMISVSNLENLGSMSMDSICLPLKVHLFLSDTDAKGESFHNFSRQVKFSTTTAKELYSADLTQEGEYLTKTNSSSSIFLVCNTKANYTCYAWNSTHHIEAPSHMYEIPSQNLIDEKCYEFVKEPQQLVLHTNFFDDNFGHWNNNHVPMLFTLLHMKMMMMKDPLLKIHSLERDFKLLVPDNPLAKNFIDFALNSNKSLIADLIAYYPKGKKVCLSTNKLTTITAGEGGVKSTLIPILHLTSRSMIMQLKKDQQMECTQR